MTGIIVPVVLVNIVVVKLKAILLQYEQFFHPCNFKQN